MCASADNSNSRGSIIYGTSAKRAYDITAEGLCAPVANPLSYAFRGYTQQRAGGHHHVPARIRAGFQRLVDHHADRLQCSARSDAGLHGRRGVSHRCSARKLRARCHLQRNVSQNVDLAASGFDLGTQTLDIAQALSTTLASVYYTTTPNAPLGLGLMRASTFSAGTSHITGSFASVPGANQASGDTYLVDMIDSSATASRRLLRRFHSAANVTATMPQDMTATITLVATTPYLRPRYVLTQRAGATTYNAAWYYSPSKQVTHNFNVQIEPPYLSGTGQATVDFPDLSGVSGWNAAWSAPSAAAAGLLGRAGRRHGDHGCVWCARRIIGGQIGRLALIYPR